MEQQKLITIVTITYNRKDKIERLYKSLLSQNDYDFCWVVVDDGSSDSTANYVNSLIARHSNNNTFPITLYQNDNVGKYKEINFVLSKIKTKLMFFLDSDDYLVKNGIKLIKHYWFKRPNLNIGSIIFERGYANSIIPIKRIASEHVSRRYYYLVEHKVYGDYSDVFVTERIADFRFPEYGNEKFMTEGPLYYEFSKKNNSLFVPKILTIGSYLDSGLTKNIRKNQVKNYQGTLYETNLYLNKDTPLFFRIKKGILYDYVLLNCPLKTLDILIKSKHLLLLSSCLPLAFLLIKLNKK